MRKSIGIIIGLIICQNVLAAENERDLQQRQQANLARQQQQQQEQQFLQQDQFFSEQETEQSFEIHSFEELTYALLSAINNKQTDAIQELLDFYRQDPQAENGMILFAEANLALNQGKFNEALALYKKLSENEPHFIRGKLDLARLYFANHQLRQAQQLFDEVDLPDNPNVMNKVRQYEQAIQQREDWQGSFLLGYGYTKNINQSANKSIEVETFIPPFGWAKVTRSSPEVRSGMGLKYAINVNKYKNLWRNHGVYFDTSLYGDFYKNNSDYNEHDFSVGLGYRYRDRQQDFIASPLWESVQSGQHLLLNRYGINLNYAFNSSSDLFSIIDLTYKTEHYKNALLKDYNGQIFSLSGTQIYSLNDRINLFGGLNYSRKGGTLSDTDKYQRYGVFIGMDWALKSDMILSASANFRRTQYRQFNPVLGEKRRDNEQIYHVAIKFPRFALYGFIPSISYKYTRVTSNVDFVYSYKKQETYFKIERRF